MAEIDDLQSKLRITEDERDKFKEKVEKLDAVLVDLSEKVAIREAELKELKSKAVGEHNGLNGIVADGGYEALKQTVADLITQNEEKSLQIEELRKAVHTYQKVEEIILGSQASKRHKSGDNSAAHTLDRGQGATSPLTRSSALLPTEETSGPPVVRRVASVQRSNSYDASKFNRTDAGEESNMRDRKVSCTSLPKDYGYKVNIPMETPEVTETQQRKEPKKKRGFKRFFARMRRSGSHEVILTASPLKRGGVRATAGGRLGGSRLACNKYEPVKSDTFFNPFSEWTAEQVSIWLQDIGFSMYVNDCNAWCKGGQHMLDASQHEIEKNLKMQHVLHRKKLALSLDGMRRGSRKDHMILDGLNTECVMKWLDDIGLPQYKHQFYDARIDGRMLNHLTVDDLLVMKINNALHHMSIKRGIEVLRGHQFNLSTLKRRPSPERSTNCSTLNSGAPAQRDRDISLWTNHRVMEWLRMIDLSEYAANLRGSGVHGALIMLEPRFTMEHLADILIIPMNKSLIRRHLSGHFINLVGQQVQAKKRETELDPSMTLTLNMKVKGKKANPFKRGRPVSEYLCPIEDANTSRTESQKVKTAVAMYKKELNKQGAKKRDAKLKRQSS
ncbi:liprin-beta-1-like [Watersipora subatra]|uniref:liprin-beta-1-like n=1 Tax=Watersipora subatra TaxID=2589382 RepID=UPI00355C160E